MTLVAHRTLGQRQAREGLDTIAIVGRGFEILRSLRLRIHLQMLPAQRELLLSVPIAHPPVVADALQSAWQHVQQDAANELASGQGHRLLRIAVAIVLPAERYMPVFDVQKSIVRDGHPMGIAADVVEQLLGAGEGCFGIDHPLLLAQRIEISPESLDLAQSLQRREELELPAMMRLMEQLEEAPAEEAR